MSIKKLVSALLVGCALSFAFPTAPLAQQTQKTKTTKAKPIQKKSTAKATAAKKTQASRKATKRKASKPVNKKTTANRKRAVIGSGAVAAMGSNIKTNRGRLIYSLMDLNTGEYLEGSNTDKVHSLASLTKLMSSYVFMKHHPDLENCEITVTNEDKDTLKHTRTRVSRGTPMSCEKILEAVLVMSDNWAAASLARSLPGFTEKEFIQEMNKQARMWGMRDTKFADPAGVDPRNKSTAKDLNILISQLNSHSLMKELSTKRDVSLPMSNGRMKEFHNTNMLIRENFFKSTLSKTGYINESGYNLVFVPQFCAEGRHLALVVMGAKSSMTRASFARQILNKYNCV